ncbi:hypothetical protein BVRB_002250 [Beta vulgaris subsp. vulgaris]|uniref:Myb-like domain-containing protein n=1 Tax=Beta vulgaris subsp. vulgaris TaxID=3555 RepID=A0A0J8B4F9_BETVV|nr:hypothetical protein BVRB_002250 [Beta vulgaris subsp. vulgaris]
MTVDEKGDGGFWSKEQDKAFENAIATHPEDLEDRWENSCRRAWEDHRRGPAPL